MEREDLCGRVRSIGPCFEQRLRTLDDLPIVGDVRGSHFMLCVESGRDRTSKEPFGDDIEIGNGEFECGPQGFRQSACLRFFFGRSRWKCPAS